MKRSYSIGAKVTFVVGLVVAGYAGSLCVSIYKARREQVRLSDLSSLAVPMALDSQSALVAFNDASRRFDDAMMIGDADALGAVQESGQKTIGLLRQIAEKRSLAGMPVEPLHRAVEGVNQIVSSARPTFDLVTEKGPGDAAAQEQIARMAQLTTDARSALTAILTRATDDLHEELAGMQRDRDRQTRADLILFGIVIGVAVTMITLIVRRSIVRPVLHLAASVNTEAESISDAARQFDAASRSLAEGAAESTATLQESSTGLTHLSKATQANSERARRAAEEATVARSAADQGAQSVTALTVAMSAIQASSREISNIIKTIDEIAFQTNILALNAAVEAARAGTAGAGFAVVADEVRALAQRSASAARETAEKLEQAASRSNEGAGLSDKVARDLAAITARVRSVDALVAEITAASKEQIEGIERVTGSMDNLRLVTEKNASLAEQTSESAREVGEQTKRLRDVSIAFDQLARGGTASQTSPSQRQAKGGSQADSSTGTDLPGFAPAAEHS